MAERVSLKDAVAATKLSQKEKRKNPAMAAGLSLLFNGLGQVYNGQLARGVLVLLGSLLGLFVMIVPGVVIWLWGGYDAYRTAKGMNEGTVLYREGSVMMIVVFMVIWAVVIFGLSAAAAMMLVTVGLQGMA